MRRTAVLGTLLLPAAATAAEVDLPSMLEHDGLPVLDSAILGDAYRQLVMEIGTMVANKPSMPAETLGVHGFAFDAGATVAMTEAANRQGEPSPWERASPDETSPAYQVIPTFAVRKGLPLSTEVGFTAGWIADSDQGTLSGYGRIAVLEGYRPLPDVSLQLGYGGYVGHSHLDAAALDVGVTMGTTIAVGSLPGVNNAQISPWGNFTTLRVRANPVLDEETIGNLGAVRFQNTDDPDVVAEAPIVIPRFGGGFQVTSSNIHFRFSASWAPATIPEISTGLGCTF